MYFLIFTFQVITEIKIIVSARDKIQNNLSLKNDTKTLS